MANNGEYIDRASPNLTQGNTSFDRKFAIESIENKKKLFTQSNTSKKQGEERTEFRVKFYAKGG